MCCYIVYFTSNKVLGYAKEKENCMLQSYHLYHCGIDKEQKKMVGKMRINSWVWLRRWKEGVLRPVNSLETEDQ